MGSTIKHIITVFLIIINYSSSFSQDLVVYKKIDTTKLYLEVYSPKNVDATKTYPAMVFYFGGGWNGGNRNQFERQASYLSKRGLVCFLVDYRVKNKHNTSPFESLIDAKSAIRFIRKNANAFNIDENKIIASGGSAGGHLASATALISDYNASTDDLSVSCIPNALVLFNPVIDNGPNGYGYERIGNAYSKFSPLHNIKKNAPPTLFLLGTKDHLVPVETAKLYRSKMEEFGNRCDLMLYKGEAHGFFNYKRSGKNNFDNYRKTLEATDNFLKSLGYLSKEPKIIIE